MAVPDIPANLIVNERTSYEQYLWKLPGTGLYRWDSNIEYMYLIRAEPVEGQGLPPLPPVPPIPEPFSAAQVSYLKNTYVRTVNGIPVDESGNVALDIIDAVARQGVAQLQGQVAAKADLVNGLVPTSQLPAITITDTFVVATQAAMLALDVQRGDLAVRTDLKSTFVLAADDATKLASWVQLPTPTDAVLSVNGKVGVVVLSAADVGAVPANVGQSQVFATDQSGNPSPIPFSKAAIGNTMAQRDSGGGLTAADPSVSSQVATKNYTDQQVATRVKTVNGVGPDANGDVAVSGGGGGGGVPTSRQIATASALTGGGDLSADRTIDLSSTSKASIARGASSVQTVNGLAPDASGALALAENSPATEVPLCIYGDSFTTGAGATVATRGFAPLLNSPARLNPFSYNMYGVSGTIMMEIARNVLTANNLSATNRRGLHVINSGINSIINTTAANDAQEKIGFVTAMKSVLRIIRGTWLAAQDTSIVYTGTWVDKTLAANTRSVPVKQSDVSGSYATITTSAAEIAVMVIGFAAASGSDGTDFTMLRNGVAFTPEVSTTSAQTSPLNPWSPLSIRVVNPNPGTNMTVRITRTTGNSFYIDGYVVKAAAPPVVMFNRIIMPTQAGLNVNGAAANRTPENVTYFNNLMDQVVNLPEFQDGNVKIIEPPAAWNNALHRASDQLHPNNIGHKLLAANVEAAARALPFSTGLNL